MSLTGAELAKEVRETQGETQMAEKRPLVVTTAHRGVFFGYGEVTDGPTIRLERARMCIYWPAENKGVLGLAADGPKKGSKVGPAAQAITLRDTTAVVEVSPAAVKAWEAAPWS